MNELFQLKEKAEEKKRLESQLKKTLHDYNLTREKHTQLEQLLKKEFNEVKRLEDGGITSLFYSILGNKIEKLEKERQEYLAVKLKHENCVNELEKWEIELSRIRLKISQLGNPEKEYKQILVLKSAKLKQLKDQQFIYYESQVENQLKQKNELNEAIEAGETALKGLRFAIQELKKAKNWGLYDMVGGGLLATSIKHSKIDEAKILIQNVQVWLKIFKRELSDTQTLEDQNLSVELDSFSTFADYFFDNLIFDWVVQEKISRSLEVCENVCKKLLKLVTHLRIRDVDTTEQYNKSKIDFINYLEKAEI